MRVPAHARVPGTDVPGRTIRKYAYTRDPDSGGNFYVRRLSREVPNMPPRPPVPNVVKIEFLWTQNGVPAANVQHFSYLGGPPTAADLDTFANVLGNVPMDHIAAFLGPAHVLQACQLTDLSSDTAAIGASTIGAPGTSTQLSCPASACLMSSLKILRRYRGGHPRCYWPGPDASHLATAQTWDSDSLATYQAMEEAIDNAIATAVYSSFSGQQRVQVSYFNAHVLRPTPVVDPVIAIELDATVRSQRRRLTATAP